MDIALLRTCLAVYRTGSLTKAARSLGVSQPTVTGHLRALEKTLSEPLFERTPSGAVPTEAAHELIRETMAPLDSLETVLARRLNPTGLADRTVRLAGPVEIIGARVLPAVSDLIQDGLRLSVTLGRADDLVAGLVDDRFDLVIATSRPTSPGVLATPFMDEEFALVGGTGHAVAGRTSESRFDLASDLRQAQVIAYADHLPIIDRYWTTAFGIQPPFHAAVTVPDLRAVLTAVLSGAGVSVLPTYLCAEDLDRGDLVVLHEMEIPPLNTMYLVTKAGARPIAAVSMLRAHLLAKARLWH